MKFTLQKKEILLPCTVAATGAVLMILELTASRTLAPAIGTSLISWTGIIGTVMAWLSVGYLLGGRLADRDTRKEKNRLPEIILSSGLAILASILCVNRINAIATSVSNPYVRVLFASSALFAVPTIAIGSILPYAMKQSLLSLRTSGTVVGAIYTYSTVGSILGTFFGGFYLLGTFGNIKVLLLLSVCLFILAIMHAAMTKRKHLFPILGSILGLSMAAILWQNPRVSSLPGSVADIDSRYNRIWVVDKETVNGARPMRFLKTGPGAQSSVYLDGTGDLSAPYLRFFRMAFHEIPDAKRILVIGGGAYTFPSDALKRVPGAMIDVVEIDPALEPIARTYFGFTPNPRIRIINDDARLFVQQQLRNTILPRYDAIFLDAFDHAYAIPSHLTTVEFVRDMERLLDHNGVIFVNTISALTGRKGKFFRAEYWTYKQVFPYVSAFTIDTSIAPEGLQNIVLVARRTHVFDGIDDADSELNGYRNLQYSGTVARDVPFLTDDFSPSEQYLAF